MSNLDQSVLLALLQPVLFSLKYSFESIVLTPSDSKCKEIKCYVASFLCLKHSPSIKDYQMYIIHTYICNTYNSYIYVKTYIYIYVYICMCACFHAHILIQTQITVWQSSKLWSWIMWSSGLSYGCRAMEMGLQHQLTPLFLQYLSQPDTVHSH